MDFNAGLLLFLFIFFVLPLIQRMLGGAKQAPPGNRPPAQRRPGVPPGQAEGRSRLPEGSRAGTLDQPDADEPPVRTEAERAADMIPDDLWEVLTGERRSPASSQRQRSPGPEPEPDIETEPFEWGTDAQQEWQPEETAAQVPETHDNDAHHQPSAPADASWRYEHEDTGWAGIPTETPAPVAASERRSKAATAGPPHGIAKPVADGHSRRRAHTPEARRQRMLASLTDRSELKRAFVLREVLGPPKALE